MCQFRWAFPLVLLNFSHHVDRGISPLRWALRGPRYPPGHVYVMLDSRLFAGRPRILGVAPWRSSYLEAGFFPGKEGGGVLPVPPGPEGKKTPRDKRSAYLEPPFSGMVPPACGALDGVLGGKKSAVIPGGRLDS